MMVNAACLGLPDGLYAIKSFADESGNGKLDTNLIGLPVERYGSSNDGDRDGLHPLQGRARRRRQPGWGCAAHVHPLGGCQPAVPAHLAQGLSLMGDVIMFFRTAFALLATLAMAAGPAVAQEKQEPGGFGISSSVDGEGFFLNPKLKAVSVKSVAPGRPATLSR